MAMTDLPANSGPTGETVSLLRVLDELDRVQKMLEEEFPECKIGYSYSAGRVTWSAQVGPALLHRPLRGSRRRWPPPNLPAIRLRGLDLRLLFMEQ
jgi:hypothetical protein